MASDSTNDIKYKDDFNIDKALDDFYPHFVKIQRRENSPLNEEEELSNNIFFELNKEGNILFSKSPRLRYLGFSKEYAERGINIDEIFPDDYKELLNNIASIKTSNDVVIKEYDLTNVLNETFLFKVHIKGIFEDNNIIGYKGILSNVNTEQEQKRTAKKNKSLIKCLFTDSSDAKAVTNRDGKVIFINEKFTELFGYSEQETIGKNILDLIVPEEYKAEAEQHINLVLESQRVTKQTIRKNKVGNKLYVSLSSSYIFEEDQYEEVIVSYSDITRERRLNILQKVLYNISSSVLTLPNINEFYGLICKEFNELWLTDNFFIALYDKETESISLPYFVDEKDKFEKVPVKQTLTGWVILNKKPVLLKKEDIKNLEKYDLVKLIGSPCAVWMGVPLEINGNILGIICLQDYYDENRYTEDDLTLLDYVSKHIAIALDRRFLLDNLNEAKNAAEKASMAKQSFLSTMSHEIRTPLNEVIGIANILSEENTRPEMDDYLKSLIFSSNHLLALVNDVLDYSKIEAGKIVLERLTFNMNDYLHELERAYTIRANTKGLSFNLIKEGDIPLYVIGDQVRLNQVVSNLFSNALKFTKDGYINLIVKEKEKQHDEVTLEFSMQDTGIGIEPDKLEAIFEDFTQASLSTTRQYGGTGLGLAICKKLVELFGSQITVESEVGKGSTFTFDIKLQLSEYQSDDGATEVAAYLLKGKKILLAEDNKINSLVANRMLSKWGVELTHAENGKIAVEKVLQGDYDLILMDLHMPVMDGIEAAKIIRASEDPKIKNIPIIALSAVTSSDCQEEVKDVRFDDFVLKPFKPENLFNVVSLHLLK